VEVVADGKGTLTNRFDFQPPYDSGGDEEVLYVKELVLGPNSVLNIGLNRLYYESLEGDPNAVRDKPPLGFLLDMMTVDSDSDFGMRVTHNNVDGSYYESFPRIHVERVEGLEPDPSGMMRMRNWLDLDPCSPTYQQVISARAKGLFGKSSEDKILLKLEYLFETADPNAEFLAELVVYLSDVPELLADDDPGRAYHYIEIGRLPAPPLHRPGSEDSGQFGVFEKTVSPDYLDFTNGMWVEIKLIGPAGLPVQSAGLAAEGISRSQLSTGTRLELTGPEQESVSAFINNLSVEIHCSGICMDVDWNTWVSEHDFLTAISGCGLPATLVRNGTDSMACLDGVLSGDGFVDPLDIVSWDWAMNDLSRILSFCGTPLSESVGAIGTGGNLGGSGSPSPFETSSLSDLLILGKRGTSSDPFALKLEDRLYAFDSNGEYVGWSSPTSDRCNIRLVRRVGRELYQINSEAGVRRLGDSNEVIIPPDVEVSCPSDPRYNKSATVYIGIQGTGTDSVGRPILDVAFDANDANYVYVVPVVVKPGDPSNPSYAAAAKLHLLSDGNTPYSLVQLYDDAPPAVDREYRNSLREIEVDGVGNVYVINANRVNENDILWKYDPNGAVLQRVYLDSLSGDGSLPDPCDPIGLYVSNTTDMVYLTSAQYNPGDIDSTVIYGFSNENLSFARSITISGMQHATSIAEAPATGILWVEGFSMKNIPQWPDPTQPPFYHPYLAKIPHDSNAVLAVSISDSNSHDLALPMSIVWAKSIKCGGADIDGDGEVMFKDFAVFALAWLVNLGETSWNPDCNISVPADGVIDNRDLAILIKHWLETGCL
jgi:hypothetical protein